MKLPYSWLKDYTNATAAPRDYAHRMTMTGSKVEAVHECAMSGVVCARITSVTKHPDSDHLSICLLDTGAGEHVQVVSGAPNLRVGDIVPLAVPGAQLPGMEIKSTVMRGASSDGMLCSFQELGLAQSDCPYAAEDGILVFPPEMNAAPGADALELLGLTETVIEFEITPNRPDCLSIIGLARETAASYDASLVLPCPAVKNPDGDISEHLSVEIKNPELCMRYTAGMARDIKIEPSPQWMRDRLRSAGIRPINNIVDITNYVMLEYGQPMHAFDYSCISQKKIVVRSAGAGESITTLDGQTRIPAENTLLIADPEKAIGIAGVMGGENSEITPQTNMIVFESACFSGPSVRTASRHAGLRTEASGRFEKGLDSENTMPALLRALELVEQLGAGRVLGGVIDVYPAPKRPRRLKLDCEYISRLLGISLPRGRMEEILTSLGFTVDGDDVIIPYWRDDVDGIADLTEEIGRICGFDNIPSTLFASHALSGGLNSRQVLERELASSCRACGFYENRSISFMNPRDLDKLMLDAADPRRAAVKILNPLGEEHSLMRTTLMPALLSAAALNLSFRTADARLYEIAMTYHPQTRGGEPDLSALPEERKTLAMLAFGDCDFYDFKGWVSSVLGDAGLDSLSFEPLTDSTCLHPGRAAYVIADNRTIATLGQVHPMAAAAFGMDAPVFMAEILVDEVFELTKDILRVFRPMPRFPASTRDLAIICGTEVLAGSLDACIRRNAGPTLESLELFDVYAGPQVGVGKKSVAYSLAFRSPNGTLSDTEIDTAITAILAGLKADFGAVLR